jgi:hypothetical protein
MAARGCEEKYRKAHTNPLYYNHNRFFRLFARDQRIRSSPTRRQAARAQRVFQTFNFASAALLPPPLAI